MGMQFLNKLKGDYAKLALIIIVIGAVVRFALAAISHPAGDSCWHLSVARFMAENGRIPFAEPFGIVDRQFFSAAPLFHFIAAAVYKFFSLFSPAAAEFAFKLVSPFFGSLTLLFVFLLGKRLYNSRVAFFATLFVAFLPLHINSSVVSFVDSLTTLLAIVAVYLLFCRRIFLSALFIGLGLEAKQTMLMFLPFFFLILLVYYKDNLKAFFSKSIVSGVIIALIGFPWLVRSYFLFGNPVWPVMTKFFGGLPLPELAKAPAQFSFGHLFSLDWLARFHLELFGAPLGSLSSLSFVNLPFLGAAVAVWVALTLLFLLPAFIGVFVRQRKQHMFFLYGWILPFLLIEAAYIVTMGLVTARFFLPATPAVALLWALGLDSIFRKFGNYRLIGIKASVAIVVIGCVFAFSAVETAKTVMAANAWSVYDADFGWIRANTPKDALIGYNGQCMSFNAHRFSNYNLGIVDYVWVNQNFRLEPESIVEPEVVQQIQENFTAVYQNPATLTVIYRRK